MKKTGFGQPCEEAIWYALPYIRMSLAKELSKFGLTQHEIGEKLGLTQAAVSQYLNGKRGKIDKLDNQTVDLIKKLASKINTNKVDDLSEEICAICNHIKNNPELLRKCGADQEELNSDTSCRLGV